MGYECAGCHDSQTLSPRVAGSPAAAEFCRKTTMSAPVVVVTEKLVDVPRYTTSVTVPRTTQPPAAGGVVESSIFSGRTVSSSGEPETAAAPVTGTMIRSSG